MYLYMLTLVTCWYEVKSKFNKEIYKKWMTNLINNVNNFNLVIYTNKECSEMIMEILQPSKRVKIEIAEWDNFLSYKYDWIENHERNNELNSKSRHNVDWKLNMLWNEKINFVKKTIDNEYFTTDWYAWCDIGYFRDGGVETEWPSDDKILSLNKNKIYYGFPGNMNEFENIRQCVLNINDNNMPIVPINPRQISIAGGFFLCHKTKLDWYHNIFYTRLSEYFKHKYLVKDDQIVVIDCIVQNGDHFEFVKETNPMYDKWFVMKRFLL
jgi:hypothetical protein